MSERSELARVRESGAEEREKRRGKMTVKMRRSWRRREREREGRGKKM